MSNGTAAANAPTRANSTNSRGLRSSRSARSLLGRVDNKQALTAQVADELQDVGLHDR